MPNWNIQNIGSSLSLPAHGRGWGKGNIFSYGAFCEAKNEVRRRRNPRSNPAFAGCYGARSEGGQKFLPRRVAKRLLRGVPPNLLGFESHSENNEKISVARTEIFSWLRGWDSNPRPSDYI